MHIPDGFIDGKTAAASAVLAATGVGVALRQVRRQLPPRRIPLLGLAAAFIFAAQMINFPVVGGTSGHLLGGVLVAALLGPSAAVVAMTTVLIVQAFLFGDGGILALGANVLNMAVLGVVSGYVVFVLVSRAIPGTRGQIAGVAFGGWCSTVIAAANCAGQLAWSGTVSGTSAFPAMIAIHMLIGIGEGLIGAMAYFAVVRTRPDLVRVNEPTVARPWWNEWTVYAMLAIAGLALFVSPFACHWPDGLDSVATKFGFDHRAATTAWHAPVKDYQFPGLPWNRGATALAGLAGCSVVFGLALLLARSLVRKGDQTS